MFLFFIFSIAFHSWAETERPPLIVLTHIELNGVHFGFPQEHLPGTRATRVMFGDPLRIAMKGRIDAESLSNNFAALVSFNIWHGPSFHVERIALKEKDGRRTHYRVSVTVPPQAGYRQIAKFAPTLVAFIPTEEQVRTHPRKLRPFRENPTRWQACTDWLVYDSFIKLF